jgi:hypothetical protein
MAHFGNCHLCLRSFTVYFQRLPPMPFYRFRTCFWLGELDSVGTARHERSCADIYHWYIFSLEVF